MLASIPPNELRASLALSQQQLGLPPVNVQVQAQQAAASSSAVPSSLLDPNASAWPSAHRPPPPQPVAPRGSTFENGGIGAPSYSPAIPLGLLDGGHRVADPKPSIFPPQRLTGNVTEVEPTTFFGKVKRFLTTWQG
jgi:hypothetical protein